jgi:hypothetical protein
MDADVYVRENFSFEKSIEEVIRLIGSIGVAGDAIDVCL